MEMKLGFREAIYEFIVAVGVHGGWYLADGEFFDKVRDATETVITFGNLP